MSLIFLDDECFGYKISTSYPAPEYDEARCYAEILNFNEVSKLGLRAAGSPDHNASQLDNIPAKSVILASGLLETPF